VPLKIASHPGPVNAHGKTGTARQKTFRAGFFLLSNKIGDPILLALSAVVSKRADTGAAASPDSRLLSPVQILIFPD